MSEKRRRAHGTGSLTMVRKGVWRLRAFAGTDPVTKHPRQVSKTIEAADRKTAQAELNRFLEEVNQGRHDWRAGTVGHLLVEYMRHLRARGRAASTLEMYEGHIRRRIDPAIGGVMLRRLSAKDLDELYARCGSEGLGPATVATIHAILTGALSQAVKWDWVPFSVAAKASPPRFDPVEMKAPAVEDLARLAMAAYLGVGAPAADLADPERPKGGRRLFYPADPDMGAAIMVAALTGCRRGELVGLRWSDVDWSAQTLRVERQWIPLTGGLVLGPPKGGKARTVEIGSGVVLLQDHLARMRARAADLGRQLSPDGWLLSYDAGLTPINPKTLGTYISGLARRVGLAGLHTHSLRHYNATQLVAAGFDPKVVATQLGHSKPSITLDVYSHALPRRGREAGDYMASLLPSIPRRPGETA